MSKKMMLLALAAVSAAMFAMPAVASATFNHLDKTSTFKVHGPAGHLSTTQNEETVHCTTTTGEGTFTTTTTATMELVFHGCNTTVFGFKFNCTSPEQPTGTIATTPMEADLIELDAGGNGIRVRHDGARTALAHFECAGQQKTVAGSVIGTLIEPDCNVASNTATVDFNWTGVHGKQEHKLWTNNSYNLTSNGIEAAMNTHATITFPAARTLTCT
jgi:hypothetical protein